MLANGRENVLEVFDRFHAAVSELAQLSFDVLTTPDDWPCWNASNRKLGDCRHRATN
jgi:hypothetical protein